MNVFVNPLSFYITTPLALVFKQVMRGIAYLWPRDKKLIAIGAWLGDRYCDNPMYLAQYLLNSTDYRVVWVGKRQVYDALAKHERMRFVEKGTLGAVLALLRAGTWVCCISMEWDLTTWPLEGNAKLINTWHGWGIKRCTNGAPSGKKSTLPGRIMLALGQRRRPWIMVGGEQDVEAIMDGNERYASRARMLRIGTPSNDYLLDKSRDYEYIAKLKKKYADLLGYSVDQKVVLYLPTWRMAGEDIFSFFAMDNEGQAQWADMLKEHNASLLEKHHPRTLEMFPNVGDSKCSIPISAEMQRKTDVHELFLIADVMISDYSGACEDFGVLKKPCIHYMYDLEDYERTCSGFIPGWRDMLTGPMVREKDDLLKQVSVLLDTRAFSPAIGFAKTCEYQTGRACEQLVEFINYHA